MATYPECLNCTQLQNALKVEKGRIQQKIRLIKLLRQLSETQESKFLKQTSEEYHRIFEVSSAEADILRARLETYLKDNTNLKEENNEHIARLACLEKEISSANGEITHLLFVNKQLTEVHTETDAHINSLKEFMKYLSIKVLKFEPYNVNAKKIFNLKIKNCWKEELVIEKASKRRDKRKKGRKQFKTDEDSTSLSLNNSVPSASEEDEDNDFQDIPSWDEKVLKQDSPMHLENTGEYIDQDNDFHHIPSLDENAVQPISPVSLGDQNVLEKYIDQDNDFHHIPYMDEKAVKPTSPMNLEDQNVIEEDIHQYLDFKDIPLMEGTVLKQHLPLNTEDPSENTLGPLPEPRNFVSEGKTEERPTALENNNSSKNIISSESSNDRNPSDKYANNNDPCALNPGPLQPSIFDSGGNSLDETFQASDVELDNFPLFFERPLENSTNITNFEENTEKSDAQSFNDSNDCEIANEQNDVAQNFSKEANLMRYNKSIERESKEFEVEVLNVPNLISPLKSICESQNNNVHLSDSSSEDEGRSSPESLSAFNICSKDHIEDEVQKSKSNIKKEYFPGSNCKLSKINPLYSSTCRFNSKILKAETVSPTLKFCEEIAPKNENKTNDPQKSPEPQDVLTWNINFGESTSCQVTCNPLKLIKTINIEVTHYNGDEMQSQLSDGKNCYSAKINFEKLDENPVVSEHCSHDKIWALRSQMFQKSEEDTQCPNKFDDFNNGKGLLFQEAYKALLGNKNVNWIEDDDQCYKHHAGLTVFPRERLHNFHVDDFVEIFQKLSLKNEILTNSSTSQSAHNQNCKITLSSSSSFGISAPPVFCKLPVQKCFENDTNSNFIFGQYSILSINSKYKSNNKILSASKINFNPNIILEKNVKTQTTEFIEHEKKHTATSEHRSLVQKASRKQTNKLDPIYNDVLGISYDLNVDNFVSWTKKSIEQPIVSQSDNTCTSSKGLINIPNKLINKKCDASVSLEQRDFELSKPKIGHIHASSQNSLHLFNNENENKSTVNKDNKMKPNILENSEGKTFREPIVSQLDNTSTASKALDINIPNRIINHKCDASAPFEQKDFDFLKPKHVPSSQNSLYIINNENEIQSTVNKEHKMRPNIIENTTEKTFKQPFISQLDNTSISSKGLINIPNGIINKCDTVIPLEQGNFESPNPKHVHIPPSSQNCLHISNNENEIQSTVNKDDNIRRESIENGSRTHKLMKTESNVFSRSTKNNLTMSSLNVICNNKKSITSLSPSKSLAISRVLNKCQEINYENSNPILRNHLSAPDHKLNLIDSSKSTHKSRKCQDDKNINIVENKNPTPCHKTNEEPLQLETIGSLTPKKITTSFKQNCIENTNQVFKKSLSLSKHNLNTSHSIINNNYHVHQKTNIDQCKAKLQTTEPDELTSLQDESNSKSTGDSNETVSYIKCKTKNSGITVVPDTQNYKSKIVEQEKHSDISHHIEITSRNKDEYICDNKSLKGKRKAHTKSEVVNKSREDDLETVIASPSKRLKTSSNHSIKSDLHSDSKHCSAVSKVIDKESSKNGLKTVKTSPQKVLINAVKTNLNSNNNICPKKPGNTKIKNMKRTLISMRKKDRLIIDDISKPEENNFKQLEILNAVAQIETDEEVFNILKEYEYVELLSPLSITPVPETNLEEQVVDNQLTVEIDLDSEKEKTINLFDVNIRSTQKTIEENCTSFSSSDEEPVHTTFQNVSIQLPKQSSTASRKHETAGKTDEPVENKILQDNSFHHFEESFLIPRKCEFMCIEEEPETNLLQNNLFSPSEQLVPSHGNSMPEESTDYDDDDDDDGELCKGNPPNSSIDSFEQSTSSPRKCETTGNRGYKLISRKKNLKNNSFHPSKQSMHSQKKYDQESTETNILLIEPTKDDVQIINNQIKRNKTISTSQNTLLEDNKCSNFSEEDEICDKLEVAASYNRRSPSTEIDNINENTVPWDIHETKKYKRKMLEKNVGPNNNFTSVRTLRSQTKSVITNSTNVQDITLVSEARSDKFIIDNNMLYDPSYYSDVHSYQHLIGMHVGSNSQVPETLAELSPPNEKDNEIEALPATYNSYVDRSVSSVEPKTTATNSNLRESIKKKELKALPVAYNSYVDRSVLSDEPKTTATNSNLRESIKKKEFKALPVAYNSYVDRSVSSDEPKTTATNSNLTEFIKEKEFKALPVAYNLYVDRSVSSVEPKMTVTNIDLRESIKEKEVEPLPVPFNFYVNRSQSSDESKTTDTTIDIGESIEEKEIKALPVPFNFYVDRSDSSDEPKKRVTNIDLGESFKEKEIEPLPSPFNYYVNRSQSNDEPKTTDTKIELGESITDKTVENKMERSEIHEFRTFHLQNNNYPDQKASSLEKEIENSTVISKKYPKRKHSQDEHDSNLSGKRTKQDCDIISCETSVFLFAMKYFATEAIKFNMIPEKYKPPTIDIYQIKKKLGGLLVSTAEDIYVKLNKTVELVKTFPETNPSSIAKAIISCLSEDKSEEVYGTYKAPKLTRTTKLCHLFAVSYIGYNKDHLLGVLKVFEEHLCSFNDKTLLIREGMKCSVFYTVLCRSYDMDDKVKKIIYDILYAKGFKAYPFVYKIIGVWSDILPNAYISKDCLLTQTIVYILLAGPGVFDDQRAALLLIKNLRDHLQKSYGYKLNFTTKDTLSEMLVRRISEKDSRLALILLCKREGLDWAQKKVVEKYLIPTLNAWKEGEGNEHIVCQTLITIGEIVRGFPLAKATSLLKNVFELFESILRQTKSVAVAEATVEAISLIRRHNLMMCSMILIRWKPKTNTITKETLTHIRHILSVKSMLYWSNLYKKYSPFNSNTKNVRASKFVWRT